VARPDNMIWSANGRQNGRHLQWRVLLKRNAVRGEPFQMWASRPWVPGLVKSARLRRASLFESQARFSPWVTM